MEGIIVGALFISIFVLSYIGLIIYYVYNKKN